MSDEREVRMIQVNTADEAIAACPEIVASVCRDACFSRDTSLQTEALEFLKQQLTVIDGAREASRSRDDEADANAWLAISEIFKSVSSEYKMWIALKGGDSGAAWDLLVSAQNHALWAKRADTRLAPIAGDREAQLMACEQVLFPRQSFLSPAFIMREGGATCSICQSIYGQCDHLSGEAYNGEFCHRIIHEIDLREISIVDEPSDKRRRITATNGTDFLTGMPNGPKLSES